MNTTITKEQLDQVNSIVFNGISVMDCSTDKLIKICKESLTRFDDYQQLCCDQSKKHLYSFFNHSFSEIEKAYAYLMKGGILSLDARNQIRMILKETEKLASSELILV